MAGIKPFKVGDAVRLNDRGASFTGCYAPGSIGYVKDCSHGYFIDVLLIQDGRKWSMSRYEIELLETDDGGI